jgi:hypothetical protein
MDDFRGEFPFGNSHFRSSSRYRASIASSHSLAGLAWMSDLFAADGGHIDANDDVLASGDPLASLDFVYSCLKAFTGSAVADFTAWKLTVRKAVVSAAVPEAIKVQGLMPIR